MLITKMLHRVICPWTPALCCHPFNKDEIPPLEVLDSHIVMCLTCSLHKELVNSQSNSKFVMGKKWKSIANIVSKFYVEKCISRPGFPINNPKCRYGKTRELSLQDITWSTFFQICNPHFHTLNPLFQFCYRFILFYKCTCVCIPALSLNNDFRFRRYVVE